MRLFIFFIFVALTFTTSAKEKTISLNCEGERLYFISPNEFDKEIISHLYELRWMNTYYKLFYEDFSEEFSIECSHSKNSIFCNQSKKESYTIHIHFDRFDGRVYHTFASPKGKTFTFYGRCRRKNKPMF